MIEKIEITQRFNFKRLNRHYECFTIDFINKNAYYKISERGSGDKFLDESTICDNSWIDILVDLRRNMTSKIYKLNIEKIEDFILDFKKLNLFDNFESEKFSYFEKLELIYSCNVIIYSSNDYKEYSFKNNFPQNWVLFGQLLKDFIGFDVLHLNYQKQIVTPLFFNIKEDGVYFNNEKLSIKSIEFGHYQSFEIPRPRLIINYPENTIDGYIDCELNNDIKKIILNLLEKYHVYLWTQNDYHTKSNNYDSPEIEGSDWYLEIVFMGNKIWHLFGYNEYPDTYIQLAREIIEITGMDLLELNTICETDIVLFEKYGNIKL